MSLLALTSASVGLNVLLLFYIVYTRMRQLKRANELYEEVKRMSDYEEMFNKAKNDYVGSKSEEDTRSDYEVLADIRTAVQVPYSIFYYWVGRMHSLGLDMEGMKSFASMGVPVFEWFAVYFHVPVSEVTEVFQGIGIVHFRDVEEVFRSNTGPGRAFYKLHELSRKRPITERDAEAMSIFEDEQIRTGKMDVPPLNGSGAKGRMSDES
jgi:hypothetical protein